MTQKYWIWCAHWCVNHSGSGSPPLQFFVLPSDSFLTAVWTLQYMTYSSNMFNLCWFITHSLCHLLCATHIHMHTRTHFLTICLSCKSCGSIYLHSSLLSSATKKAQETSRGCAQLLLGPGFQSPHWWQLPHSRGSRRDVPSQWGWCQKRRLFRPLWWRRWFGTTAVCLWGGRGLILCHCMYVACIVVWCLIRGIFGQS